MIQAYYYNSKTLKSARFGFNTSKARWEINNNGEYKYYLSYKKACKKYRKLTSKLENE